MLQLPPERSKTPRNQVFLFTVDRHAVDGSGHWASSSLTRKEWNSLRMRFRLISTSFTNNEAEYEALILSLAMCIAVCGRIYVDVSNVGQHESLLSPATMIQGLSQSA
ncbi:hypothetical protein Tco_0422846 [Tanacetum coccineum]